MSGDTPITPAERRELERVFARERRREARGRRPKQKRLSIFGIGVPGSEHRHTDNLPARTLADLAATARDAPRGAATSADAFYEDWRAPVNWARAVQEAKREGRKPGDGRR